MISFDECDWIYGIWFIGGEACDWLGCVYKFEDKWWFRYRFHHYVDDVVRGSDDQRRWYFASAHDATDESFKMMKGIFTENFVPYLERMLGSKADFVLLECEPDDDKIPIELDSREWANAFRGHTKAN